MKKVVYEGPLKVRQVDHVVGYRGVPVECEDGFAAMLVGKFGFAYVETPPPIDPTPEPDPAPSPKSAEPESVEAVEPEPEADGDVTIWPVTRRRGRRP